LQLVVQLAAARSKLPWIQRCLFHLLLVLHAKALPSKLNCTVRHLAVLCATHEHLLTPLLPCIPAVHIALLSAMWLECCM
jgi:hypothetical protein